MENFKIISHSSDDTIKIAKIIASKMKVGDTIILTGELGAGKTKFTEGFLSYFNMQDEISSPTFNIVNEYISNNLNIYHFDVYRLENSDEFYEIGGEEYFEKGISIIEWGEIIEDALPKEYLKIVFEKDILNENKRIISIYSIGKKYMSIINELKEELI